MYFVKRCDLRNELPSTRIIPAKNVDYIIYGCCASIVMVENWQLHAGCVKNDQQ